MPFSANWRDAQKVRFVRKCPTGGAVIMASVANVARMRGGVVALAIMPAPASTGGVVSARRCAQSSNRLTGNYRSPLTVGGEQRGATSPQAARSHGQQRRIGTLVAHGRRDAAAGLPSFERPLSRQDFVEPSMNKSSPEARLGR